MASPFDTADATIFGLSPAVDATVTQGATTYTRRVLLSLDVESVDMTSGAVARINTAQFPRCGGLKTKTGTVTIGATVYTLEQRLSDDGYAETWRVS